MHMMLLSLSLNQADLAMPARDAIGAVPGEAGHALVDFAMAERIAA